MRLHGWLIFLCAGLALPSYWGQLKYINSIALLTMLILILLVVIAYFAADVVAVAIPCNYARIKKTHLLFTLSLALCFLIGINWSLFRACSVLKRTLASDWQVQDLAVRASIASLPEIDRIASDNGRVERFFAQRFIADVIEVKNLQGEKIAFPPTKMRLSWYQAQPIVQPGQVWDFTLRVRDVRSYLSTGAFDYRLWLLKQGVTAQASIKAGRLLSAEKNNYFWNKQRDKFRNYISRLAVKHGDQTQIGLLLAVVIGDRSLLSQQHWDEFQKTGTAHLISISGLHVAMAASLVYLLVTFVLRYFSWPLNYYPRASYAAALSLLVATLYAFFAGFSLPTQRALIMLFCLLLAQLTRSQMSITLRLLLALLGVLIIDPWAMHSASLYLSFLAVIALVLGLSSGLTKHGYIRLALLAQYYLFWVVTPLTLYCFYQFPVLTVVANLIAIPVFAICILPLCILLLLISMSSGLADIVFVLLNSALHYFSVAISFLAKVYLPSQWLSGMSAAQLGVFMMLSLLILFFRLKIFIFLYLVAILALFIPTHNKYPLQLHVFDVGQGLAVLIRTKSHQLLYDTGVGYNSGFNMADAVIVPFLKRDQVRRIDRLIISHADLDHAGAANQLLEKMQVGDILLGDPKTLLAPQWRINGQVQLCKNQHWQWDGVSFAVVYANPQHPVSNERSCILLVRWRDVSILLPGDIAKQTEKILLKRWMAPSAKAETYNLYGPPVAPLSILLAPHHGSRSSSSRNYLNFLMPQQVVFSSGYKHQFGHPHGDVLRRYQQLPSKIWRTDQQGTISFYWDKQRTLKVQTGAAVQDHYWNIKTAD